MELTMDLQNYSQILQPELAARVCQLSLEQQIIAKKTACKCNIAYFVKHYLSEELPLRIPEFHVDIYDHLINRSLTRLVFRAPTGFAKTSVVGFAFPTYLACYKLGKRLLYLSATASFAERRLRDIKQVFENNSKIRNEFEVEPGDIWRDNEITLSNGFNILALGAGSQITGERPDYIIADDVESEEDAKSEVKRAALNYWWDATVMNRPATDGRVILIGSRSSPLAFLNRFDNEPHNKIWVVKDYTTTKCKTIWKEKWSDKFLEQKKQELAATPGIYAALYEGDVSQTSSYTFRKEWIRFYDKQPEGLAIFTCVDPAVSDNMDSDFTAIVTGGIDQQGNIFILDIIKKRFNAETLELFGALFTIYEVYKPVKIGIESVGFQKYIKLFFEAECRKRGKYPQVVEIKRDTKVSKMSRISSLAPLAQSGQLFIRQEHYDFISEWEAYPSVIHDDVLDAASMLKDLAMPRAFTSNKGAVPRYKPTNSAINF